MARPHAFYRYFYSDTFLAITRRMASNFKAIMPLLMPAAMLCILPVLYLSFGHSPASFYLNLGALLLFLEALLVTMLVETPVVAQVRTWTPETLAPDCRELRDLWKSFDILRVAPAILGLIVLLISVIFQRRLRCTLGAKTTPHPFV